MGIEVWPRVGQRERALWRARGGLRSTPYAPRRARKDKQVRGRGVTGVLCFTFGGKAALSGAAEPDVLLHAFEGAWNGVRPGTAGVRSVTANGPACAAAGRRDMRVRARGSEANPAGRGPAARSNG